jgi:hypothetical protein
VDDHGCKAIRVSEECEYKQRSSVGPNRVAC